MYLCCCMNVYSNRHPKPVGCLAKDMPVMFMCAGKQIVYTSTIDQLNLKVLAHKCGLYHTLSKKLAPGNLISGSEYDAEIGPMHFDTHRGCQSKRAQKVSHFLGTEPVSIFCPWVAFVWLVCHCKSGLSSSTSGSVYSAANLSMSNVAPNQILRLICSTNHRTAMQ